MIHRKRLTYSLLAGLIAASLVLATLLVLARTTATLAAPINNIPTNKNNDFNAAPLPIVFTVTTTTDENDGACGPSPEDCSLRDAILKANNTGGTKRIVFAIPGCGYATVCLIQITTGKTLPITGSYITIDGYTEYGASPASGPASVANINVAIDGNGATTNGFNVTSDNNTIRGLAIYNFAWAGISIWGSNADHNVIKGNHIGIDATGEITHPNSLGGVIIGDQASNNTIGGSTDADRNVISGNKAHGIAIITSTLNTVLGNYIGLNATGQTVRGNGLSGVYIGNTSNQNTVGGNMSNKRNIIAGNGTNGVEIRGSGTTSNTVSGNYIGLDREGLDDLHNKNHGVYIYGGAQNNIIGGSTEGERNVISGHDYTGLRCGVYLYGANTRGNTVSGNYIGVYYGGSGPIPNSFGIALAGGANHNIIGGDATGEGNLISGNLYHGVSLVDSGTAYNIVSGNIIGTNEEETENLGNGLDGVFIGLSAQHNTIGGDAAFEHNVISANGYDGVYINGSNTMSNTILGNYIGTGLNGVQNSFLGNGWHGVRLDGDTKYNLIGGFSEGERNVISDNDRDGVRLSGNQTMLNIIAGNIIGLGSDGSTPAANTWYGVTITDGAKYNLVGGFSSSMGNIISGNNDGGVLIAGAQTAHNQVSSNIIGLAIDGVTQVINVGHGVEIRQGAHDNYVGGDSSGERNIISGNYKDGVRIEGNGTMSNTVSGNFIGTDIYGTTSIRNIDNGVTIDSGAQHNLIGGDTAAERNIISGHSFDVGVLISDTSNNTVSANYIGLDVSGNYSLPNSKGVQLMDGTTDNLIGGNQPGERNVISGNNQEGIYISRDGTSGNQVLGNYIGTTQDGQAALGNGEYGVLVEAGAQDNTIGPGNVIANNDLAGVYIHDATTLGIAITQNSIYNNFDLGIGLASNANGNIQRPNIAGTAPGSIIVTGTACQSCLVELFSNLDANREGRHYQGSSTADSSGHFTITVGGLLWPYLTATATDPISGTSEFSWPYTAENRQLFLPVIFR